MVKKEPALHKSTKRVLIKGVSGAAKVAKRTAKAVLVSGRTLTPPVEIEPNRGDASAIRALQAERERLLNELNRQDVVEQEHPTTGNHIADDASEVSEQAKSFALRRHLEGMVKEIDRALVRAERGIYGVCERCGHPISEERLKVMPSACLCIDCAKLQVRKVFA